MTCGGPLQHTTTEWEPVRWLPFLEWRLAGRFMHMHYELRWRR